MRKLYLAGPMTGLPEFNFPAFNDAARALRDLGFHVFNPAEFDVLFHPTNPTGQDIRTYIRRDVHIIINELDPANGDGVVLLPGWVCSRGASAEFYLARWCGLPIWSYEEFIRDTANRLQST